MPATVILLRYQQIGQQSQRPVAGYVNWFTVTAELRGIQQMDVKGYGCPPSGTDRKRRTASRDGGRKLDQIPGFFVLRLGMCKCQYYLASPVHN